MHNFYLIAAITLNNATAGKVLGEIGSVYLLLQGLKKAFPALSGKWMVLLNVALSLCGSALIIPPDSFFSTGTLVVVLLAGIQAAGSAGIHGTVQNVAPVALQTVLGQGPKTDAPMSAVAETVALHTNATQSKTSDPYEDILK